MRVLVSAALLGMASAAPVLSLHPNLALTATLASLGTVGIEHVRNALVRLASGGGADAGVLTVAAALGAAALGAPGEGALVLVLFAAAQALEMRLTVQAKGDLDALRLSLPSTALVVHVDSSVDADADVDIRNAVETRVEDLRIGDLVVVGAGAVIPADARVVQGTAFVTLEHITGESVPVAKGVGDAVPGGGTNVDGVLVLKVSAEVGDSTPERLAKLAREAQRRRPDLERRLSTFADVYSKAVLLAAALLAVFAPLLFGIPLTAEGGLHLSGGSMYRAAAFVAAAAPCALLMTPLAYVAALAGLARRGILVSDARALDALALCGAVALDKTGTITSGRLKCAHLVEVSPRQDVEDGVITEGEALGIAALLEQHVRHPVAEALVRGAEEAGAKLDGEGGRLNAFVYNAGAGAEGIVRMPRVGSDLECRLGSPAWVVPSIRDPAVRDLLAAHLASEATRGSTVAVLHVDGGGGGAEGLQRKEQVFCFALSDSFRPDVLHAVNALEAMGLKVAMLTGDNAGAAANAGEHTGISDVRHSLSPADKIDAVRGLRSIEQKRLVAMVGDGINDLPALAAADVGVSLRSTAAEVPAAAQAAAQVVLVGDAPFRALPRIFSHAKATQAVLRQNLAIACISIAAAALPSSLGILPLWVAVALHEGSTLLVALNCLRLVSAP